MKWVVALLLVPAWAACSSESVDPAAIRAAIDSHRRDYMQVYTAGDVERTIGLYTADAVLMPQFQPALVGHDAIRRYLRQMFDQVQIKLTLSSEEITIVDAGFAYDRGRYSTTAQPKRGGSATDDVGKYLVLWRKQSDGSWKIERDIDNSSNPLHWERR